MISKELKEVWLSSYKTIKGIAAQLNKKNIQLGPLLADRHRLQHNKLKLSVKVEKDENKGTISINCGARADDGEYRVFVESTLHFHSGGAIVGTHDKWQLNADPDGWLGTFLELIEDTDTLLEEEIHDTLKDYSELLTDLKEDDKERKKRKEKTGEITTIK